MKGWIGWLLLTFSLFSNDYPLLSKGTFVAFADHFLHAGSPRLDPLNVKTGDAIFVTDSCLPFFFKKILPKIQSKFVLITCNGCRINDERHLSFLEDPHLAAWFGMNMTLTHPKAHCIPLGIAKVYDVEAIEQDRFFEPKPIHTYLNIRPRTHPSRLPILDYFAAQPFCEVGSIKPFEEYIEDLKNSRFVISPRGGQIDCFRTWETLYAGSIPVVESWGIDSLYEDLPVLVVDDLTAVTQEELDAAFEEMKGKVFKLEKLYADYWFEKLRAAKQSCFL